MPWTSEKVSTNGTVLNIHRTGGDKPPLVLCHGITDNGLCWRRVAARLEADFDVIMVDARGHGDAGKRMDFPGKHDHADDLAGLIDALALDRPAFMGHSMGARTVASLAAFYPQLVSRAVLEDPPFNQGEDSKQTAARRDAFRNGIEAFAKMSLKDIRAWGEANHRSWDAEEFDDWARSKQQVSPDVLTGFSKTRWQDVVKGISCPALLVYGDRELGGIVDADTAHEISTNYPNITSTHLQGAGHNIRREAFEPFMTAISSFLQNGGA